MILNNLFNLLFIFGTLLGVSTARPLSSDSNADSEILSQLKQLSGTASQYSNDTSTAISNSQTSNSSSIPSTNLTSTSQAQEFLTQFYQAFMNPGNAKEAKKINSTFFTDDCKGRVSLTRDFVGIELNTEYIFGLFSDITPVDFKMIGVGKSFKIVDFISNGNKAASSTIIDFYVQKINFTIPVQIDMWLLLDTSSGYLRIAEYDAVFRNFDRAYEITNQVAQKKLKESFPLLPVTGEEIFKDLAIESICKIHDEHCTGDNQQYRSFAECFAFLKTIPIGEGYSGGRNTIFCRNIHQVMLPFRPAVHCPHIGPSGGEMCRDSDTSYDQIVNSYTSYFTTLFNEAD